jgi:enterochelin esterase-like enzyme
MNNRLFSIGRVVLNPILFMILMHANAREIKVSGGTIQSYPGFKSRFVTARNIDVWLPDGYSPKKKYAVLYMHDGQMLFDSTDNWNHSEWEVDETMTRLLKEKKIRDCIVVGIWNVAETRHADYFPEKVIGNIPEPARTIILEKQLKGPPRADNYLKFLVTELKPFIDSTYPVKTDRKNTFIMGSSMGGLISAYAVCEYPEVFGGAACLSIHSPVAAFEVMNEVNAAEVADKFRAYLTTHLPKANTHKFYFDYGDQTGDSLYRPYQTAIDQVMTEKGYSPKYWETRFFQGESHSEHSWAKRLEIPLLFLLKRK